MPASSELLLTLGSLLLIGLAADAVGRKVGVPRVTLLMGLGVFLGPSVLDLLPEARTTWFPVLTDVALTMVGVLLGGEFALPALRRQGRQVVVVTVLQACSAAFAVGLGLWALGFDPAIAVALGGIAAATDPAAIADVVAERGRPGPAAKMLLAVVALDDVVALLLFGAAMSLIPTAGTSALEALEHGAMEIALSIGVGTLIGLPVAWLAGRIQRGEPTLLEAISTVLVVAGAARALGLSPLLAAVAAGTVIANGPQHHDRPLRAIAQAEGPFLVVFFLLAGASVDLHRIGGAWGLIAGYVALRTVGKYGGTWLACHWTRAPASWRRWLGACLAPQAGVALGLALAIAESRPGIGDSLLAAVIVATVVFELVGPIGTRVGLGRIEAAGDSPSLDG